MSIGEALTTPPRMHLVDLSTGEDMEVMFNPEAMKERIEVAYSRLTIPGLSHRPLQYTNTGNHEAPIELYFQGSTEDELDRLDDWRRFMLSLAYPKGNAGTIDDGAPPRILFVWPNVWTFTVILTSIEIASSAFSIADLRITRMIATLGIEEIRDVRLTSEDVRRNGTRRSSSGGGVESA